MRELFYFATGPRCGSNLFITLLNSVGACWVAPYLYDARELSLESDKEVLNYINNVPCDHPYWGVRVDIRDLRFVERYLSITDVLPAKCKWIWLRRVDKVKQAISHYKAEQTDTWHLYQKDSNEHKEIIRKDIKVPLEILNGYAMLYLLADNAWDRFFYTHSIHPYTIRYEDFAFNPEKWDDLITSVLEYLQVPFALPVKTSTDRLKQSSLDEPSSYRDFFMQNVFTDFGYNQTMLGDF